MRTRQSLNGNGWTVEAAGDLLDVPDAVRGRVLPVAVPGVAHDALQGAGLMDDIAYGRNELAYRWTNRAGWIFRATFRPGPEMAGCERVELVFDRLDTVATVEVNGRFAGRAENEHHPHRFDVRDLLRPDEDNTLVVRFEPPLTYAERREAVYGPMPRVGGAHPSPVYPYNMIRKTACNFGWDWGPVATTCGIPGEVRLEGWDRARIEGVRPVVRRADDARAEVEVCSDLVFGDEDSGPLRCVARLTAPTGERVAEGVRELGPGDSGAIDLEVAEPALWWPIGHGPQPLYRLEVEIVDSRDDRPVDRWEARIGLRTVELVTAPDADGEGESFYFRINGRRVYAKGTNWIPDHHVATRATPERVRRRVEQAAEANMNMLRVWGGGTWENPAFYEACDELGILVWQDFLFACAAYHECEPFRSEVEAESRHAVKRLTRHPSVVLWNGCNENLWGPEVWGPEWEVLPEGDRPWGPGYYFDLLPRIVEELAPTTPYWPGSPYSGDPNRDPNEFARGNVHIWDVWVDPDAQAFPFGYRNYLRKAPRFAAEFGFQGPCAFATLASVIPGHERGSWDAPTVVHHNKQTGGQTHVHRQLTTWFEDPPDFDAWHYLAQVTQARAMSCAVEWFRALSPWNSGALIWQHNDNWPVVSWSAIDFGGRPKPMWYAARRFFAPRLLTIMPAAPVTGDAVPDLALHVHNDSRETWGDSVRLRRLGCDGATLESERFPFRAEPGATDRIEVEGVAQPDERSFWVADLEGRGGSAGSADGVDMGARSVWFPHPDKATPLPAPRFTAEVERSAHGCRVAVTAETVVRDLCLFADRLDPDAAVSEQLVTLLPGERAVFDVASDRSIDAEALTRSPVLRCVGDAVPVEAGGGA